MEHFGFHSRASRCASAIWTAAIRETGGELQLLARMVCDATTFGDHDFDLGPDGAAQAIAAAAKAGLVPAVLASASAPDSTSQANGMGEPTRFALPMTASSSKARPTAR